MFNGDKLIAKVPLNCKKSLSYGVVILYKMRNCTDCKNNSLCDNCDKLVNQRKDIIEILKEKKVNLPKTLATCFLSICN